MIRENAEAGGPSFPDVQRFVLALAKADWNDARGPLRLSNDLKLEELAGAAFFVNARLFMQALADEDGTDATATHNLNRAFVRRMFDRMVLPKPYRESTIHVCKVLNEQDVWPLHLVRIVAECAGLVKQRKKRFTLAPRGRELLADDRAGELYRALFVAYFRRFNLTYDFHLRPVPAIQDTFAVILWRLDCVAREWVPVRGLAPEILLPNVHKLLRTAMTHPQFDTEEWILAGHVLEPLVDLGLLEKQKRGEWPSVTEEDSIRVTNLWRRFISFAWQFPISDNPSTTMSERPKSDEPTPVGGKPRCGLCGKTGKLTRTPCCGNWICDDADQYVPFSYARNSCFQNHAKYTICAFHHHEGHKGRWQDCAKCREDQPLEMYVHSATNEYNFEALENPPKFEPTHCSGCGVIIRLAEDGYTMKGKKFFCEACAARESGVSARDVLAQLQAPTAPPRGMEKVPVRVTGKRGEYPLATLAYYGPDDALATKLVVAVVRTPDDEEGPLHRWITHAGDIREDATIAAEVESFLKQHRVKQRIITEQIIGCPHEEGKDYPEGGECPHCPFWHNRDRFTRRLLSETPELAGQSPADDAPLAPPPKPYVAPLKIGRNDPCPCGSGKKYKKCCGR
jgi:hypothetical protein